MGDSTEVQTPDPLLLDGGPEAYPRMLSAIAAAQSAVRLEVYQFTNDVTGQQFVAALAAAALRGVRVAVVLDGWGSVADGDVVAAQLRDAGCRVTIYNPLASIWVGRFRRNHRKILLVDEEVAFLGGINVGDEYGRAGDLRSPRWIDLAIELRGAPAAWLSRRLRGLRERAVLLPGPVRIHLSGMGGGRPLRRRYLETIEGAQQALRIAHAYFLPDRRLVRSIAAAARRGVDVCLLLPGRSDVPLVRAATRSLYGQLLRAGVRIYEWTETVLHAKAAVMDSRRLLVGSFNLDPFSLSNLETLVEVEVPEVAQSSVAWMDHLLARASPITMEYLAEQGPIRRWFLDVLGLITLRLAKRIGRLLALG